MWQTLLDVFGRLIHHTHSKVKYTYSRLSLTRFQSLETSGCQGQRSWTMVFLSWSVHSICCALKMGTLKFTNKRTYYLMYELNLRWSPRGPNVIFHSGIFFSVLFDCGAWVEIRFRVSRRFLGCCTRSLTRPHGFEWDWQTKSTTWPPKRTKKSCFYTT
jgi:hypothetical protein